MIIADLSLVLLFVGVNSAADDSFQILVRFNAKFLTQSSYEAHWIFSIIVSNEIAIFFSYFS
jgi:hypothetical protein